MARETEATLSGFLDPETAKRIAAIRRGRGPMTVGSFCVPLERFCGASVIHPRHMNRRWSWRTYMAAEDDNDVVG